MRGAEVAQQLIILRVFLRADSQRKVKEAEKLDLQRINFPRRNSADAGVQAVAVIMIIEELGRKHHR